MCKFVKFYQLNRVLYFILQEETKRSEADLRNEITGLKDAIFSRDKAIRYYQIHSKNFTDSFFIPSVIKCSPSPTDLYITYIYRKQFPPLQKVINPVTIIPQKEVKKDEKILIPHPPIDDDNNNNLKNNIEPATLDNMNKPIYSVQVGKWGGQNYRWKSLGLYRQKNSGISITTSIRRPSSKKKKYKEGELVNRLSPNQCI